MQERTGVITFKGGPLTLVGPEVAAGQKAPEFAALANNLSPRRLADYKGRALIIASVPSLDTGVCDIETRRFNEEAGRLGKDVAVLAISMDLPFAQARWCGAAGIEYVTTLSDHRDASFGTAYGVLIKELRLLARAVFVVDRGGGLVYVQIVPEATHEPDYSAALAAARAAM
jgi:thiol peroxidase